MNLVARHQERAPGFVQVLSALITVDEDMTTLLKRNQVIMMKYFLEAYPRVAHVFEFSASRRYVDGINFNPTPLVITYSEAF